MRTALIAGLLLVTGFLLQGCALGVIAAGVGASKAGTAKKIAAQTKEKESYGAYRIEMEKLNLEREKAGLEPRPMMSYEEWAGKPAKSSTTTTAITTKPIPATPKPVVENTQQEPVAPGKAYSVGEWLEEDKNRNLIPDSKE